MKKILIVLLALATLLALAGCQHSGGSDVEDVAKTAPALIFPGQVKVSHVSASVAGIVRDTSPSGTADAFELTGANYPSNPGRSEKNTDGTSSVIATMERLYLSAFPVGVSATETVSDGDVLRYNLDNLSIIGITSIAVTVKVSIDADTGTVTYMGAYDGLSEANGFTLVYATDGAWTFINKVYVGITDPIRVLFTLSTAFTGSTASQRFTGSGTITKSCSSYTNEYTIASGGFEGGDTQIRVRWDGKDWSGCDWNDATLYDTTLPPISDPLPQPGYYKIYTVTSGWAGYFVG